MIFLNVPDCAPGLGCGASDVGRTWTFDNAVICVMSNFNGSLEVASSPLLGAPGTIDPAAPFHARGMEGNDGYVVAGSSITVTMRVSQPGDWIRVITQSCQNTSILKGSGIEGDGIDDASGRDKNYNSKSKACQNAGKK
jgi:hypothetical protein